MSCWYSFYKSLSQVYCRSSLLPFLLHNCHHTHPASLFLLPQLCWQIQDSARLQTWFACLTSCRAMLSCNSDVWVHNINIHVGFAWICMNLTELVDFFSMFPLWHAHRSPLRSTSSIRKLQTKVILTPLRIIYRCAVRLFTVENYLFLCNYCAVSETQEIIAEQVEFPDRWGKDVTLCQN